MGEKMDSARVMFPLVTPALTDYTAAMLYTYAKSNCTGVVLAFVYRVSFIIDHNRLNCPSGTPSCPYGVHSRPQSHMLTVTLALFGEFRRT